MKNEFEDRLIYHVVEVIRDQITVVHETDELDEARDHAYDHAVRTGLMVEIRNEFGRILERLHIWRE